MLYAVCLLDLTRTALSFKPQSYLFFHLVFDFILLVSTSTYNHFELSCYSTTHRPGASKVYQLVEEDPVPSLVADLTMDICPTQLELSSTEPIGRHIRLVLFPTTQPFFKFFEIRTDKVRRPSTSDYTLRQHLIQRKTIDREVICPHQPSQQRRTKCRCYDSATYCAIFVQIAHKMVQNSDSDTSKNISLLIDIKELTNLELRVIDQNDNPPQFELDAFNVTVSELDPPGSRFRLPPAIDLDMGQNGLFSYRICEIRPIPAQNRNELIVDEFNRQEINNYHFFDYFHVTTDADSQELFLQSQLTIDREQFAGFVIKISATDQGVPVALSSNLTINLTIQDVNDNYPEFDQLAYTFIVCESASIGTMVGRVEAHDVDADKQTNGRISYAITQTSSSSNSTNLVADLPFFNIDRSTGDLKVARKLDRELTDKISLMIEARDHGSPSRSSWAEVKVTLLDINDARPNIQLWGRRRVLNTQGLIRINPTVAIDSDLELLTQTLTPTSSVDFWLTESIEKGSIIAYLFVIDQDAGLNGTVECTKQDNATDVFILSKTTLLNEQESGQEHSIFTLTTSRSIDRESVIYYLKVITCHDLPTNHQDRLSSTVKLSIHIHDENDNAPLFSSPPVVFHSSNVSWLNSSHSGSSTKIDDSTRDILLGIGIECKIDQLLFTFRASDLDYGRNAQLSFIMNEYKRRSLDGSDFYNFNSNTSFLSINSSSGGIYLTKHLSTYTTSQLYWYNVVVKDNGQPQLSSNQSLVIKILSKDIDMPQLKILDADSVPVNQTITFSLKGHDSPLLIGQLLVESNDLEMIRKIEFKILNVWQLFNDGIRHMTDHTWFSIDPSTGKILLKQLVDHQSYIDPEFLLSLEVSFLSQNSNSWQSTSLNVTVKVIIDRDELYSGAFMPPTTCYPDDRVRLTVGSNYDSPSFATIWNVNVSIAPLSSGADQHTTIYPLVLLITKEHDTGAQPSDIVPTFTTAHSIKLKTPCYSLNLNKSTGCLSIEVCREPKSFESENFEFNLQIQDHKLQGNGSVTRLVDSSLVGVQLTLRDTWRNVIGQVGEQRSAIDVATSHNPFTVTIDALIGLTIAIILVVLSLLIVLMVKRRRRMLVKYSTESASLGQRSTSFEEEEGHQELFTCRTVRNEFRPAPINGPQSYCMALKLVTLDDRPRQSVSSYHEGSLEARTKLAHIEHHQPLVGWDRVKLAPDDDDKMLSIAKSINQDDTGRQKQSSHQVDDFKRICQCQYGGEMEQKLLVPSYLSSLVPLSDTCATVTASTTSSSIKDDQQQPGQSSIFILNSID